MSWEDEIEFVELQYPGEFARETIEAKLGSRTLNLSDLRKFGNRCVWCNDRDVTPPMKRYCGAHCKESAYMWSNPQSPQTKSWILKQQNWACVRCGVSFEEHFENRAKRYRQLWPKNERPTLFFLGYGSGDMCHVDHITPIHHGGAGLGLQNVQVICVSCHKKKTIKERIYGHRG